MTKRMRACPACYGVNERSAEGLYRRLRLGEYSLIPADTADLIKVGDRLSLEGLTYDVRVCSLRVGKHTTSHVTSASDSETFTAECAVF